MSIRLIELKTDETEEASKFLLEVSSTCHILHYEELFLDKTKLNKYFKEHKFPKDKFYTKNTFLSDLNCEGYILVEVERRETAEYIAELLDDLI